MADMKLTSENVNSVFISCLFKDGEPRDNYLLAEGVQMKVGFHPTRLKENEATIAQMLSELPVEFKRNAGGGMSFLNMCNDLNGNQWADLHKTMDQLVCLGIASGKLSYVMEREHWNILPGGMPYLVVN